MIDSRNTYEQALKSISVSAALPSMEKFPWMSVAIP
jgi:hypothetical protein